MRVYSRKEGSAPWMLGRAYPGESCLIVHAPVGRIHFGVRHPNRQTEWTQASFSGWVGSGWRVQVNTPNMIVFDMLALSVAEPCGR